MAESFRVPSLWHVPAGIEAERLLADRLPDALVRDAFVRAMSEASRVMFDTAANAARYRIHAARDHHRIVVPGVEGSLSRYVALVRETLLA